MEIQNAGSERLKHGTGKMQNMDTAGWSSTHNTEVNHGISALPPLMSGCTERFVGVRAILANQDLALLFLGQWQAIILQYCTQ